LSYGISVTGEPTQFSKATSVLTAHPEECEHPEIAFKDNNEYETIF
jgi:hypothetical protein